MEVIYKVDEKWPPGPYFLFWKGIKMEVTKAGLRRSLQESGAEWVTFIYRVNNPLDGGSHVLKRVGTGTGPTRLLEEGTTE